ncbi:MAG TPA: YheU family protein [Pseudomonadales bacterium]|nr:YheU family protein [Pseudomonadales bacterium]
MEIPADRLAPDTLRAIIEEFVSREGTDYGHTDFSLEQKVEHVLEQLRRDQIVIQFDPGTESLTLVRRDVPAS